MSLHAVLFAIDFLAIFAALLLALGLLTSQPRSAVARLAALILVNSAGFLVFSRAMYSQWIPEPFRFAPDDSVILVLQVMMNTTAGLFMVLCFKLFQDTSARFPRWLAVLFAIQVALEDLVPHLLGITTRPSQGPTMTDSNAGLWLVFEMGPAALQTLFVGAAVYWTARDWRSDLLEARRVLRVVFLIVVGVQIVSYTLLTRVLLSNDDALMLYVHEAYTALGLLVDSALIVFLLLDPRFAEHARLVMSPDVRGNGGASADLDDARFRAAMNRHVYREAGLTIASLAARLEIPEYRLRRLINTRLGYRNFNQMLHAYRIADARTALADPDQRRLPILTIALSLGYQSINPFNRAFRDLEGTTPSAFRQQALAATVPENGEVAPMPPSKRSAASPIAEKHTDS